MQIVQTSITERFLQIRQRTEFICSSLLPEDVSVQPVDFVSPPKWHLAHTTWFFEQFILKVFNNDYRLYHKDFAYYFNSYYNNVGDRIIRAERGMMTRPTLKEVLDYRQYVDGEMRNFLEEDFTPEIAEVLEIGLQHEQQHQELLIYDIKYIFGHQPTLPTLNIDLGFNKTSEQNTFITMPEGLYEIGHKNGGFCWDNELGVHKVYLNEFQISKTLVTTGDYMDFIDAGGYLNFNLWHADGWDYVKSNDIQSPMYWHRIDGQWHHYTLKGMVPVERSFPVCHVSFYEAFAFAQWQGMRLPTEFEWEAAAKQLSTGQLWEWTNSAYLPYPGFKTSPGALGEYNGKFMINQMVLRGGSIATPPNHIRHTYRNFFQPDMRWLYSGIRLAE